MATARPQLLRPPAPEPQMNLPLLSAEKSRPVATQEVWTTLSPEQQARLFRQVVSICCSLVKENHQKEGDDE
jgi:hypothetical protein